jgi:hypothetical protein
MVRGRAWPVLVIALLISAVSIQPTSAHPGVSSYGWEPGGVQQVPDSYDHWYCIRATVPSADRFRMHDAMDYVDSFTNLYENFSADCGDLTDTIYRYQNPIAEAPGAYGFSVCRAHTGYLGLFCERANVILDNLLIYSDTVNGGGGAAEVDFNLHFGTRHETGHNLGFGHPYDNSDIYAMRSKPIGAYNYFHMFYIAHDRNHLHEFFP